MRKQRINQKQKAAAQAHQRTMVEIMKCRVHQPVPYINFDFKERVNNEEGD